MDELNFADALLAAILAAFLLIGFCWTFNLHPFDDDEDDDDEPRPPNFRRRHT